MKSQLKEYSDRCNEENYKYIRWLMVIAVGAFSLTAGVVFGKTLQPYPLLAAKLALTANAIGILGGAIGAYGEAKLARGALLLVAQIEDHTLQGDDTLAARVPHAYQIPFWVKLGEFVFYSSLCLSMVCWIAFIWLS